MEKSTQKTLGIYIHIPFCVRKCLYCDFLSAPADLEEMERYVAALIREIRGESSNYAGDIVKSVFLGGGTPSLLPAESIEEILDTVYDCFDVDEACEISMEVNPGTVTLEKLSSWKKSGVNRLSIGLQSADDSELKVLGRIHTSKDFFDTYALAIKTGFNNINIDLMSAIPGQTLESYTDTLRVVTNLQPMPVHISSYSLMIEEGTPFYEDTPVLPDEDCEREMYKITGDFLTNLGYRQYEISNYAFPGYECVHNRRYWERGNYVGFGIGAASMIDNERFQNTNNITRYCNYYLQEKESVQKKEEALTKDERIKEARQTLSRQEQMEEFMFLGLRMIKGISYSEFFHTFGATIDHVYPGIVEDFCQKGLLERRREPETGDIRIALTRRGIDVSNVVMAQFLIS
ncbi:MAG: oxygen-independent coproporphyrinogen III oxidase [Lachnospiraceae bacterium]|nr:oxygen-independent coproporphyrinogen III oxidase [Lachnospiraceae bacterium]